MRFRIASATVTVLALALPMTTSAQTTTVETSVTFLVPVNLTQLSPDIERVRLLCGVMSAAMTPTLPPNAPLPILMAEAVVISGQVNTTLRSEFLVLSGWLQDPVGKQAAYQCGLQGYKKSAQQWGFFDDASTDPVLRLKPTPNLSGTFVW